MPIKKTRPKPTKVPGIYHHDGPNRNLVRARWTDPKTGRRRKKEKVVHGSLAQATAAQAEMERSKATKRPERQRFSAYVEQWLKDHPEIQGSSLVYYVNNLGHAAAALGDWYLDAIEPADIRSWMLEGKKRSYQLKASENSAGSRKKTYSNATINGWLRVLRHVLDDAVDSGVLLRNPASG